MDGIEICKSYVRCCDACQQREVHHKVNGEMQTDVLEAAGEGTKMADHFSLQFRPAFPSSAIILERSSPSRVRFAAPNNGAPLTAPGRSEQHLLIGGKGSLRPALPAGCHPFVKAVERLGLDWVFNLKENQPELLLEASRWTAGPPAGVPSETDRELRWGHLPEVDWPVADRLVRVVKTVRIDQKREVTVTQQGIHRKKSKTEVTEESTNFYATNFQLGSISPLFIHQLGRSRWRIDTQVFQTLTVDCHLKHPAIHQSTAIVVLTMIRLLAYTLSLLFFKRQVCSHARGDPGTFLEFAKRLAYWFVAPANTT